VPDLPNPWGESGLVHGRAGGHRTGIFLAGNLGDESLSGKLSEAIEPAFWSAERVTFAGSRMPAPARPETSNPVINGAVSLIIATARAAGIKASAPNHSIVARVCIESATPMARRDVTTSGNERHPTI
jgi:hypothetical protein